MYVSIHTCPFGLSWTLVDIRHNSDLPFVEAWSCELEDPEGGTDVGEAADAEICPEDPPEVSLLTAFSALAGTAETWVITEDGSIGASLNLRPRTNGIPEFRGN